MWSHFGTALGGGLRDCMSESLSRRGGLKSCGKHRFLGLPLALLEGWAGKSIPKQLVC